jgi:cytochrome c oxidase assembly protein subunit 19
MSTYLACMKKAGGVNDSKCRDMAKSYLACRMDRYGPLRLRLLNLGRYSRSATDLQPET